MSKSLRLSEKWFRRGLWLVAIVFVSFLIGLGIDGAGPDIVRNTHLPALTALYTPAFPGPSTLKKTP